MPESDLNNRTRLGNARQLPALTVLFLLTLLGAGHAQTAASGSIRGQVIDPSGAVVKDAVLTAHSPYVGGTFNTTSDAEGNYRLIDLPPATDYVVAATAQGFSSFERTNLVVRAGLNVMLDIKLQPGSVTQSVDVTSADAPLLETVSAEQAVQLSGELIRNIPISGRHEWSDTLQVTPGIISASSDAYGGQTYFLRGSENENHATLLNGIDIGTFEQNWPSNYISMTTEALSDIQIKTGANDASSPAAMGMVINMATPSGGDNFHGSASVLYGPQALNGNNTPGGISAVSETLQPDFAISGPLKKGKAWFFGSGRYINRNDGISRTSTQLAELTSLDPGFRPFNNQARGFVYVANATLDLSERHRLFGLVQYDSRTQGGNFQYYAGNFAPNQYGGGAYGLSLASTWTKNLTTRFLVSFNNKGSNTSVSKIGGVGSLPELDVYAANALSGGRLVGQGASLVTLNNLSSRNLNPSSKPTSSGDLSYYIGKGWGTHEIQTGYYLEPRERSKTITLYANGGFIQEDAVLNNPQDLSAGYTIFHKQTVNTTRNVSSYIGANDYAWYIQDHWRPFSRLTITAGLRPDYVSGQDVLFHVNTEHAWNYAPRVGGAYMLTKNQKHVIRASWSRITDITNASYIGTASTSTVTTTDSYLINGVWADFVTPGSTALNPGKTFDPNRHQGYVQEWVAGYQTQLPGEVTIDASYIDRSYKDRPAQVDTNQIYQATPAGTVWAGLVNPSLSHTYYITNNRWNWFVYQAAEFTVTKQAKNFQIISTYSYSPDHIAGTWQPNDPAAILQPYAFANNAGIGSVRGYVTNDFTGDTRDRMWQRHQLRNGVTWQAPWKLRVGTIFTAQSGTPGGPVIGSLPAADIPTQYGPATLVINGNNVSNPLATANRFVYANRGDGQIWTAWLFQWNGRVGRQFKFSERYALEVSADIYNLTNSGAGQQFTNGNNAGTIVPAASGYTISKASSTFGGLQNVQLPRSAQFSARWSF